jgi:hypothetical protein
MSHSDTSIENNNGSVNINPKTITQILDALNNMQQYMIKNGKCKIASRNKTGTMELKVARKHWVCTETVMVKNEWSITLFLNGRLFIKNVSVLELEDALTSCLPVYRNLAS